MCALTMLAEWVIGLEWTLILKWPNEVPGLGKVGTREHLGVTFSMGLYSQKTHNILYFVSTVHGKSFFFKNMIMFSTDLRQVVLGKDEKFTFLCYSFVLQLPPFYNCIWSPTQINQKRIFMINRNVIKVAEFPVVQKCWDLGTDQTKSTSCMEKQEWPAINIYTVL